MNEIVKVCKKHGELTIEQIRYDSDKGKVQARCKQCRAKTNSNSFKKHREKKLKYIKQWKNENREKINKRAAELKILNPEIYKASREREKVARYRSPEKVQRRNVQAICQKRNISIEQYHELYEAQNGLCAICGKPEKRKLRGKVMRLTLDHCHKTGRTRKFLCHMCNIGIGAFNDDTDLMMIAINYVKEHS